MRAASTRPKGSATKGRKSVRRAAASSRTSLNTIVTTATARTQSRPEGTEEEPPGATVELPEYPRGGGPAEKNPAGGGAGAAGPAPHGRDTRQRERNGSRHDGGRRQPGCGGREPEGGSCDGGAHSDCRGRPGRRRNGRAHASRRRDLLRGVSRCPFGNSAFARVGSCLRAGARDASVPNLRS